jgi:hypothetical protein
MAGVFFERRRPSHFTWIGHFRDLCFKHWTGLVAFAILPGTDRVRRDHGACSRVRDCVRGPKFTLGT